MGRGTSRLIFSCILQYSVLLQAVVYDNSYTDLVD